MVIRFITDLWMACTAVINQKFDRLLHTIQIRSIDNGATLALGENKLCTGKHRQMCGHGVVRYTQLSCDLTSRKPFRLMTNQKPKCLQSSLLRESAKNYCCC